MSDSSSGLSEREAQEFHKAYVQGFILFTVIAAVAHAMVWAVAPWL